MKYKKGNQTILVSIFTIGCLLVLCPSCVLFKIQGGTGKLKSYYFEKYSKKHVNEAIHCLFVKYPEYKPPSKYANIMTHYYQNLETPKSREVNSDTVQFHFYINKEETEVLYWTAFSGLAKEWLKPSCELNLIGFKKDDDNMILAKHFGLKRRISSDQQIREFELSILPKLKYFLENTDENCK